MSDRDEDIGDILERQLSVSHISPGRMCELVVIGGLAGLVLVIALRWLQAQILIG